jgi:membrane-associated protein
MTALKALVDFILHIDQHLTTIIRDYGTWTYAILFLIVFCETGLVVLPLLPGDSLLFAAGSFAALGSLNPWVVFLGLAAAAIIGDNVNYWIGRRIGPRAFSGNVRFLKREYLERTEAFFARHGTRTIVLARFVPIVRTFTPFVAGVGAMPYRRFLAWDIGGGILWVGLFTWAGYFFGNIPTVRHNFTLMILAIIAVSALPIVLEAYKGWRARRSRAGVPGSAA